MNDVNWKRTILADIEAVVFGQKQQQNSILAKWPVIAAVTTSVTINTVTMVENET